MNNTILTVNDLNWKSDTLGELRHISFSLRRGTIVGLLGMDGSGADLLIKILTGNTENLQLPAGSVYYERSGKTDVLKLRQITRLINMEEEMIENWTLAEYLGLANAGVIIGPRTLRKMKSTARELFLQFGYEADPEVVMGKQEELYRKIARICHALLENAEILIVEDECIGMNEKELREYASVIRKTADMGKTVILRSQSVRMIKMVSDSVLIMRRGRMVKNAANSGALTINEINACLLGETVIGQIRDLEKDQYLRSADKHVIFRVRDIPANGKRWDLAFGEGEVVYLMIRNRQEKRSVFELLSCRRTDSQIRYILDEVALRPGLREFDSKSVVSADIGSSGRELFPTMDGEDNLLIPSLKKISALEYFSQERSLKKVAGSRIREKGSEVRKSPVRLLNQNERIRLLMERWTIFRPRVLILYEPFAYCDAYGVSMVSSYIKHFASDGTTVIVVKSPGDEFVDLADRIDNLG